MSIFYHVSTNLNHSGVFTPRIPTMIGKLENDTIGRVCVAPSIEDCLSSLPCGGRFLSTLSYDRRGYYLAIKIDTDKLNIKDKDIISSEKLYKKGYVEDANLMNEFWITTKFVVPKEDMFIINIFNWSEELCNVIPYNIYKIAKEEFYGECVEAYLVHYKEYPQNVVLIKNLEYVTCNLKEGEQFILNYKNTDEGEQLVSVLEYVKNIIYEDDGNDIFIQAKSNVNITDVFLTHIDYLKELGEI